MRGCTRIFCRCGIAILFSSCAVADISVRGVVIGSNDIERFSDLRSDLIAPRILDRVADSAVLIVTVHDRCK